MSEELVQQRDSLKQQLAEKDAKIVELKEKVAKLEASKTPASNNSGSQATGSIKDRLNFFKSLSQRPEEERVLNKAHSWGAAKFKAYKAEQQQTQQ